MTSKAPKKAIPLQARTSRRSALVQHTVVEEARLAGLLDGDRTEHVSFRVPPALLEAAKKETGLTSTTDLGVLALAMLAQRDPFQDFLERTHGALGPDHTLEY